MNSKVLLGSVKENQRIDWGGRRPQGFVRGGNPSVDAVGDPDPDSGPRRVPTPWAPPASN
ncbi:hypothetical protein GCM10010394_28240 [Streptomyces crystallinus]|uniref:Uncharacterized protein n=1 Tax=Streptomyces crystallinus TaxID=68191 RepID=A0ABP3QWH0_9ACTN